MQCCRILGRGALTAVLAVPAAAQEWKPQKNVELVVSAGARKHRDSEYELLARSLVELGVISR